MKAKQPRQARCEMFLKCRNAATTAAQHSILGRVPACDRCAAWYVKLGGELHSGETVSADKVQVHSDGTLYVPERAGAQ